MVPVVNALTRASSIPLPDTETGGREGEGARSDMQSTVDWLSDVMMPSTVLLEDKTSENNNRIRRR